LRIYLLILLLLLAGCNAKPQPKLSSYEQRMLAKKQFLKDSGKDNPPLTAPPKTVTSEFPADDRDVVVKMQFNGTKEKQLRFYLQAYWLDEYGNEASKSTNYNMQVNGKGEGKLNLGIWRLKVMPKVLPGARGKYDIELQDPKGGRVATFAVSDSGKQAALTSTAKGYTDELAAYYAEARMTGYQFFKGGSRQPQFGIVLIGKGWNYVENYKKLDLSKGYAFPQFALVIVGPEWLKDHKLRRDMIDEIKVTGGYGSGGAYFY